MMHPTYNPTCGHFSQMLLYVSVNLNHRMYIHKYIQYLIYVDMCLYIQIRTGTFVGMYDVCRAHRATRRSIALYLLCALWKFRMLKRMESSVRLRIMPSLNAALM